MKALWLTNEYPPNVYGGAGVHVDYLSRELAQLIDVEVRCFGDQATVAHHLRVRGYDVAAGVFGATDPALRGPLQALERCIRFNADPIDADVVHCHTWYSALGGLVAKYAYGIPLVVTAHSLEPQRVWKREQLGRGYDLASWVERAAIEAADHVIAVSLGMRADVMRWFDVPPQRVSVIYNGIDPQEYRPVAGREALNRYGIATSAPYVLFVGRITRQKGLTHLLQAIPHLPRNTQVVLCAGAADTREIGEETARLVDALQRRRPGVIWIPQMVDKRTVIELYSHAAVFCCPSIYEPFGLINLEAMACGTPVVASAVGGIPEVVVHGETGLLVEYTPRSDALAGPENPERFAHALAAAISRLLDDEPLRQRMGAAGRARAEQHFAWSAIARQVVQLYESLTRP